MPTPMRPHGSRQRSVSSPWSAGNVAEAPRPETQARLPVSTCGCGRRGVVTGLCERCNRVRCDYCKSAHYGCGEREPGRL